MPDVHRPACQSFQKKGCRPPPPPDGYADNFAPACWPSTASQPAIEPASQKARRPEGKQSSKIMITNHRLYSRGLRFTVAGPPHENCMGLLVTYFLIIYVFWQSQVTKMFSYLLIQILCFLMFSYPVSPPVSQTMHVGSWPQLAGWLTGWLTG